MGELPYLRYYKTDELYHGMIAYLEEGTEAQLFARYSSLSKVAEILSQTVNKEKPIKAKVNVPTDHDIEVHRIRGDGNAVPLGPKDEQRFLSMLGLK